MELFRGKASQVRVYSNAASVPSMQPFDGNVFAATFEMSGRSFQLNWDKPVPVGNGDDVVVVGESDRSGIIHGTCWVNVSRGVGHSNSDGGLSRAAGWLTAVLAVLSGLSTLLLYVPGVVLSTGVERTQSVIFATVFGALTVLLWLISKKCFSHTKRAQRALDLMNEASRKAAAGRSKG